jgi:hypothetical protein
MLKRLDLRRAGSPASGGAPAAALIAAALAAVPAGAATVPLPDQDPFYVRRPRTGSGLGDRFAGKPAPSNC